MGVIRPPAVAGMFYPREVAALRRDLHEMLAAAHVPASAPVPKALIVPHAGYVYSGLVAAEAFARLAPARAAISRVVLIGPAHRVAFAGLAVSAAEAFDTPLGRIPIDQEAVARISTLPGVGQLDAAHAQEHSLEVQLPFLQTVLDHFALVPLVAGNVAPETVARVLDTLWGGPETLIVISSDLSHYLDYASAQRMDGATRTAIERLDAQPIGFDQACGRIGVAGLLAVARRRGLSVETVDLRNSGDTAGPRDRVVGYGAWAFVEPAVATGVDPTIEARIRAAGPLLTALAKDALETFTRTGQKIPEPGGMPDLLTAPGAVFVTIERDGRLRGCIGSPTAWRPLAADVIDNAIKAGHGDPRFPSLTADELEGLEVSVSVLTPQEPIRFADEADLLRQLRPRVDGLIIKDGRHGALFLPSVWEQLPEPRAFLAHLKQKAGLAIDHWSPTFQAWRFQAIEVQ